MTVFVAVAAGFAVAVFLWCLSEYVKRRRQQSSKPVPALPVDGRELDSDEWRRLISVWIGFLNSPDDDVREDQL